MQFKSIKISDWRQFKNVEIEFHPKITIITGANGSGKTTILRLLSQHFGWFTNLLATPKLVPSTGKYSYTTGLRLHTRHDNAPQNSVGLLKYSNNSESHIVVPSNSEMQYHVEIPNKQTIYGLHINSHRPIQNYQRINSIPATTIGAEQAYNAYSNELIQRYQGGFTQFSPIYRMKESIISMATFGPGNAYVQGNQELEKLFHEFKSILNKVLPPTIGFIDISVRIPDVVLITQSGEFVIDAASGGLMSIIDLSWQIFLFAQNKDEFTVTIDEPENHLHPSMQRSILRRITEAFPKAQFIVVTHSPFVVSSVRDSFVYVLQYADDQPIDNNEFKSEKIVSVKLDLESKAANASDILRNVLGVPVTLPEWAESDLSKIIEEFSEKPITTENLNALRTQLNSAGLGEYFPEALKTIANK